MEKNEQNCELVKRTVHISDLPVEVMQHIFNCDLALTDLKRASLVCKSWYSITRYTLNRSWFRIDSLILRENVARTLAERRGCRFIRIKIDSSLLDAWQTIAPECLDVFGKSVTSLQLTGTYLPVRQLAEILQCFANLQELAIFTTYYPPGLHSMSLPILPKLTSLFLVDRNLLFGNLFIMAPNLKIVTISRDPLFNVIDAERFTASKGIGRDFEFYNERYIPRDFLLDSEVQLDNLSSIRLDFNERSDILSYIVEWFWYFPCLRNVYIRSQQEINTVSVLHTLAQHCPEISELQISWNKHGSCEWLGMLGNIKKLKVLHLSGCFKCLRGNTFGKLTPFRKLAAVVVSRLSELHLAYCCIDDKCLAILCLKAKLNYLRLQHCHFITDAWVLNLAEICPTLQRLTISQCAMIGPGSIDELQKIMPNLEITYQEMKDTA